MLTLYPAVDIKDGRAVRLTQGRADEETVYDADPVAAARRFADAGTPWLHVVDLDAAFTGEPRNRSLIEGIVEATGCKVQASGGVRTLADVEASLAYGAERVVIGTMALSRPEFVAEVLDAVGPRIAVGLDARGTTLQARGWTEEAGDLFAAIERFSAMGVPRFVYTDVAKDGMLQGPNVEMLTKVADATDASVTASGGVSTLDDLRVLADCHPRVDAAIVGKALYSGAFTLEEALAAVGGGAA
ncbi:1-(5-phosphoribosyl)-5-[(5-phosphoribosylamino)methylideneamino]imidazole-4-carboxamide isomerase [Egicoccus halophilus]|uniref:1-(5-phosphoribosyl)-5-[(5-phosphoribosylamino)methylideneamino] imidazole-4-carboxamide isomerase n=1 Tax=Egicoccus halophilus TaxID=1670830 RepID=A0A8J3A6J1_9ACTN|nr:1-(5-phosphoribosyl)-5-[(5-phosphoribosylamino)methylideneamino]imidazole-4-carboxamide isomerase [Egicoccus halophilus]GGI04375.1 1-(5-phosphoribosyl)-5-[(5-phosphoribosylamino) methylideneamino] imidazole-4-carboxamide isomerase [Egicoccus halophilus]